MCIGLVVTGSISKNFTDLYSNQMPIRVSWILCGAVAILAFLVLRVVKIKQDKHSISDVDGNELKTSD
jgi:hypothetical protein